MGEGMGKEVDGWMNGWKEGKMEARPRWYAIVWASRSPKY